MKLNLGCGGEHKKGYVNIDAFDNTIADKIMSVIDLKIDDNISEEILMSQLIEHFGIARSIFALSECFRVLASQGKLIIETPDLRESFKIYLNGEREDRKNILPWIYGVDIPGMQHRFCFPEDLIEEELKKLGFENIKKDYFKYDKHQPILRIECYKPKNFEGFQLITKYRKKLLDNSKIDLDNQINALEKVELIEFFAERLISFLKTKNEKKIEEILIIGSTKSPEMTYEFFNVLTDNGFLSRDKENLYMKVLEKLKEIDFVKILLKKLLSIDKFVGKQDELFDLVQKNGKNIVRKILYNSDTRIEELIDLSLNDSLIEEINIDFFSEKLVMLEANKLFQKGIKEFNLSKFGEAINYFEKSSKMFRDQILTYWNLGRLYMLRDDKKNAKSYYEKSLSLIKIIDYENEKDLKKLLKDEMELTKKNDYNKSIVSLRQIYKLDKL